MADSTQYLVNAMNDGGDPFVLNLLRVDRISKHANENAVVHQGTDNIELDARYDDVVAFFARMGIITGEAR